MSGEVLGRELAGHDPVGQLVDVGAFELPGDSVVSVYLVSNSDGSVVLLPVVTAASRLPAPDATPAATPIG